MTIEDFLFKLLYSFVFYRKSCMQEQKKPQTSYFTFVVLIFLGTFIYLGWMLSSSSSPENVQTPVKKGAEGTPAMSVNTSAKEKAEGIQLIPEKPENIAESLIIDVKPAENTEEKTDEVNTAKTKTIAKVSEADNNAIEKAEIANSQNNRYSTPMESIYIVKPNDTLTGIAKQVLGSSRRWREIAQLNSNVLPNPHKLKPGTRLRLPTNFASRGADTPQSQSYVVRETDSLYSIAVKFYGTPRAVEILKQANKEILSNNTELTEGMVIQIPQKSVFSPAKNYAAKDGFMKYKIKEGDTLSEISSKFYNSSVKYDVILQANPEIKDSKSLKVGSIINIPSQK